MPAVESDFLTRELKKVANTFPGHYFLLTSGSTASGVEERKWVALSEEAIETSAEAVNTWLGATRRDPWCLAIPDFHIGGLGVLVRAKLAGVEVHRLGKWSPEAFASCLSETRSSFASLVPTQIFDLVQKGVLAPKCLRAILVGGGKLDHPLYLRAIELGWPLLPTFGMTEASSQVATLDPRDVLSKDPQLTVLPHFSVRLNPEDSRIGLFGKSLLSALIYVGGKEGPRVLDPKQDGWFLTEDRGHLKDRVLTPLGRMGDFVKIGGESVDLNLLRGLFERLLSDSGKADTYLLAYPDARLGFRVGLAIEGEVTPRIQSAIEAYGKMVCPFERIFEIRQFNSFPRTELGKLRTSEITAAF